MAEFQMTLTNAGAALLAKCIAGQELRFTAVSMGDGTPSGGGAAQGALAAQKLRLPVSKITRKEDTAVIRAILSFREIAEGFYWREIGLMAENTETGAEVLYAYGYAGDKFDWIPATGETTLDEKIIHISAMVATAASVTALIDGSLVYATQRELAAHAEDDALHIGAGERDTWNGKADRTLANVADADFKEKADAAGVGEDVAGQITAHNTDAQAHQTLLAGKVDRVTGKGLSTEDYTSAEKSKLAGIAAGANNYAHPAAHAASMITQDATHRFVTDTEKTTWNGKCRSYRYTATIATGSWTAASKGWYKTVSVSGVTAAMTPVADVVQSTDAATATLQLEAWSCISRIETVANGIKVYCYEKQPQTAIPIQLTGVI